MRSFVLGCALAAIAAASPAIAGVKEGVEAWQNGDYPKAVAEWRAPANAGDPDAQFNLGQAYKLGRGVPIDPAAALDWYRKSAASGHEQAQATLGLLLFQNGQREEAMTWLKKAADQGEARAQYVVGTAYFNGDLLSKDWVKAYALMTRAKAANIGAATASLQQMDQIVPEQQRVAGLSLAREMERTAQLRANDVATPGAPLTMRNSVTPRPVGQTTVPPSTSNPTASASAVGTPAGLAPQPWRAPSSAPAATPPRAGEISRAAVASRPAPQPAPAVIASAAGGWKIQLGAFSSADAARNAWNSLSARAGLKALSPTYSAAGALTRLQAGPLGSRTAANQACAAVKAAGTTCFPVAP
ncbi:MULTISPECIES: SPOR domain-containing protein [unclassified Sphingomonas]|uniref:SPOR domain-containing protein n=1 Tax=unclassified Sphingomonas TaxID=196159 RepID=UPI0006F8F485|nr:MULTISPECIES: SPOR domain-containing protein [unclassified Sphingomonas]KQX18489.1 sporulation protein [Sphingomonas sp. Root1294]KQY72185.1 sporulation protein [Sphingomonas sp. Root50]KRB94540.1 sporulation protein [Sphingomonas sp. Root720]